MILRTSAACLVISLGIAALGCSADGAQPNTHGNGQGGFGNAAGVGPGGGGPGGSGNPGGAGPGGGGPGGSGNPGGAGPGGSGNPGGAGGAGGDPAGGSGGDPGTGGSGGDPGTGGVGGAGAAGGAGGAGGNECGINSGWPGDEYCILPPPADKGFQIHYGPTDYKNVNSFLIQPGQDTNIFAPATSGNTTEVYFYKRQYRMRKGSHHLIVSAGGTGTILGSNRRLGGSQNTVKDNPAGGVIPPENVGIGMKLAARSSMTMNLHHFNPTTGPLLKEAWVNFWYVPANEVTQEALEIFLFAPGQSVLPGGRATFHGRSTVAATGRILTLYGHRHSNTIRFSAWLTHAGQKRLVLEDYNWEEPTVLEYNTLTTNPTPDAATKRAGGVSGKLDIAVGDVIEWECEVVNNRSVTITYGENEGATSEMCILVGDNIGPKLSSF